MELTAICRNEDEVMTVEHYIESNPNYTKEDVMEFLDENGIAYIVGARPVKIPIR